MAHLAGHDRTQLLLLPEAVDDYVSPDNPVRFIEAFVDELDLAAASFSRVVPKATDRPGYRNDRRARVLLGHTDLPRQHRLLVGGHPFSPRQVLTEYPEVRA